jgi:PIN domain nuclease of toxin-antitoxin system
MTDVLDASALLAFLQDERGSDVVADVLSDAVISTVNWAEVVQKSLAAGVVVDGMRDELAALGLTIRPFMVEEAEVAARLWQRTRIKGLSLGDRACLGLGFCLKAPVLTADSVWTTLKLSVVVRCIR